MQQAREAGASRLKAVEEMRRADPRGFALLIMEFRSKLLGSQPSALSLSKIKFNKSTSNSNDTTATIHINANSLTQTQT